MYYNGSKIDKNEVVVNAVSDTLNISRNRTNTFSDHRRTVIKFHKYGNIGISDLDIDITLKKTKMESLMIRLQPFMWLSIGSAVTKTMSIHVFGIEFTILTVKFEGNIDMNKHDVKNVYNLSI